MKGPGLVAPPTARKSTAPEVAPASYDSPEQAALVDDGAEPVQPDLDAIVAQLQAQMAAQQAHIESLLAEKGQSTDPVKGAVLNLKAHVQARADAHPHIDFSEILAVLSDLPEEVGIRETELIKELVADLESTRVEAHDYLVQLARDLHKNALKAGASA